MSGASDHHGGSPPSGLVMVCDVDLSIPNATFVHTVEVAQGFAGEGLEVDLIARGPDPALPGVRYWPGRGGESNRLARLASLNLQVIRLLCRRRRRARRFYVRHRWTLMPGLLAGWLLGYRVVTQVDDIPYGPGYGSAISPIADHVQRLGTRIMSRLAHGIVAVTGQIGELLVEHFGARAARIAVLPNGVDIDFFHPLPREEAIARLGLDPALRYAVFCGNLAAWVDFDTLLRAFALAVSRRPEARLLLIGDGPCRPAIERQARALGIEGEVLLTGFVRDRVRVRDYLAAATVAISCHDSAYINRIGVSPTKVAEYMAMGRAVVAKEVAGLREVIARGGVGRLVSEDPQEMAQAILDLLDPTVADELGDRGRRLAESEFAWPSIVRRTTPLFGL